MGRENLSDPEEDSRRQRRLSRRQLRLKMAKGIDLYEAAVSRLGCDYVLGVVVPKNDARWRASFDCAELLSWAVYQTTGRLYGCIDDNASPVTADAYTGSWAKDAKSLGKIISVQEAAGIPGAAVLRLAVKYTMGHIVLSDGQGGTIEAKGARYGVVRDVLKNRRWDYGILVPWIEYKRYDAQDVPAPKILFKLTFPYMRDPFIKAVQTGLFRSGFDPGPFDGIYGPKTCNAVMRYQALKGLVVDGEVGPQTLYSLGIVGWED
mgnify:FL=1